MRRNQCLSFLLIAAAVGGACLLAWRAVRPARAQGTANARPAALPFTLKLVFGLKDTEPAVWEGSARAMNAALRRVEGWRFSGSEDQVTGLTSWRLKTDPALAPARPEGTGPAPAAPT